MLFFLRRVRILAVVVVTLLVMVYSFGVWMVMHKAITDEHALSTRAMAPSVTSSHHHLSAERPVAQNNECQREMLNFVMTRGISANYSMNTQQVLAGLHGGSSNNTFCKEIATTYDAAMFFIEALRLFSTGSSRNNNNNNSATLTHTWPCAETLWKQTSRCIASNVLNRLHSIGTKRNQGVLYISAGFGNLTLRTAMGKSFRRGWYPQTLISTLLPTTTRNFTMFWLTFHDEDIYYLTRRRADHRQRLKELLNEYPNLFLLHYSPSMVMKVGEGASLLDVDIHGSGNGTAHRRVMGALFPRMIPIPHSPQQERDIVKMLITRRNPYKSQVVWRGTTTGKSPKPYRKTDRCRMVAAFAASAVNATAWSDVAFSSVCQGVRKRELPAFRNKLSMTEMCAAEVQLDVDGNTNSWEGLRWRLRLGTAVVKVHSSNGFTQWYYPLLKNGTHLLHVPVDDVVTASRYLLQHREVRIKMAQEAFAFAAEHLTISALNRAVENALTNAWNIGYDRERRWCVS